MNRLFEAEAFVLVIDEGSFTAAAKRLGVTKSYASKLVTRLEDRLGVRLLNRTTRKLALTEPGRAYYERCTAAMHALEEAESEVGELQTKPRGRLRITVPTAFGMTYLTKTLADFSARFEGLVLDVHFLDRHADLVGEHFDAAVRAGDLEDSSLIAHRIAKAEMVLCASPGYLAKRGAPKEPAELAAHACLIYTNHAAPTIWTLERARGEVSVEVSGPLMTNHAGMLLEAACDGLGITFVPVFHSGPYLRDGRLVRVLSGWRRPKPVPIHVLYPTARHVPLKVRAFVDFMTEYFRAPPWAAWEI